MFAAFLILVLVRDCVESSSAPDLLVQMSSTDEEPIMSKPVFFGGALACLSGGMLYGFNKVMKEQKVHLNFRSHAAPTAIAGKAFAAATLLCFGTVIGVTSLFVATTGITSFAQFGKSTQFLFAKVVVSPSLSVEATDDQKNTAGMDCDEEVEYVTKRYFTGLYEDDPADIEEAARQAEADAKVEPAP